MEPPLVAQGAGNDCLISMTKQMREPSAPAMNVVRQPAITFSSSATFNAQFWLEQFPWRPTAAWAVLAALLAIGFDWPLLRWQWRTIILLLVLADPLWGSIWRLAAGRDELLPLQTTVAPNPIWLPYLKAGSPAARLFDWNYVRAVPLLFRVGLPSLLLGLVVAAAIDWAAVWMTGAVFLASILAWVVRRTFQGSAHLLHSLVTITLPALLVLAVFPSPDEQAQSTVPLLLIGFWTLHNWGEGRNLRSSADPWGLLLLGAAEIGMLSVLLFLQLPVWLAFLVLLWLPTWLAIYQDHSLRRYPFIWLVTLLLSAWAVGQSG